MSEQHAEQLAREELQQLSSAELVERVLDLQDALAQLRARLPHGPYQRRRKQRHWYKRLWQRLNGSGESRRLELILVVCAILLALVLVRYGMDGLLSFIQPAH